MSLILFVSFLRSNRNSESHLEACRSWQQIARADATRSLFIGLINLIMKLQIYRTDAPEPFFEIVLSFSEKLASMQWSPIKIPLNQIESGQ